MSSQPHLASEKRKPLYKELENKDPLTTPNTMKEELPLLFSKLFLTLAGLIVLVWKFGFWAGFAGYLLVAAQSHEVLEKVKTLI